jgi:sulfhydrogenase subunit gamma (sulfur reductase)
VSEKVTSIYLPELCEIADARMESATERWLKLRFLNGRSLGHKPGQFVEVSVFGIGEAPISVSSAPTANGTFELCLRKLGNVTGALHRLDVGAKVGIRGPFGNGFPIDAMKGRNILFVGGGLGIIPLRSAINDVLNHRSDYGKVTILYGAKTPAELLFAEERQGWESRDDVDYHITVDRGDESWKGHVGVITTLFPEVDIDPRNTVACVVGPPVMYRFVILECLNAGIAEHDIILSLERRMKCGVGKCGHCQINHKYVCQDGPVFTYRELKWLEEAL